MLRIPEQIPKGAPPSITQLHHHLDLVGFALFAPAVIQLLLAMQYGGNDFAWGSSQVIGLCCGAGVTCIVWLLQFRISSTARGRSSNESEYAPLSLPQNKKGKKGSCICSHPTSDK